MRTHRNLGRALCVTALAALLATGCDDQKGASSASPSQPSQPDGLGSISVELHLGSTLRVNTVSS